MTKSQRKESSKINLRKKTGDDASAISSLSKNSSLSKKKTSGIRDDEKSASSVSTKKGEKKSPTRRQHQIAVAEEE